MTEALKRRGPDDEGFYEGEGAGFGFRRLSIIDVAGGHQPISNEDGTVWAMLNGEIYGFQQLREELIGLGHRFKTRGDTETIVHAYEAWGDACFEKLNGMFAIALWDAPRRRLVLARDRLGKKPLFWTKQEGTIWFASEPKALIAAGALDRTIDPVSLALYFRTDSVPTPRGIFQGLQKLEPASALAWQGGKIEQTWTYWNPPGAPDEAMTPQDAIVSLRTAVDVSVHERLISDVPLGLFLSGGIDSAVVAESAARQSATRLKAFTIGFNDASHDERDAASVVANALGLDHQVEVLSAHAALQILDEVTDCLDEPLADPAILPQMMLARFARTELTVALAGDGGDELLLGYQHLPVHAIAECAPALWALGGFMRHAPSLIPAGAGYFGLGFNLQRTFRGMGLTDPWARDLAWRGSWTANDLSSLLLPDVRESAHGGLAEELLRNRADELGSSRSFWQKWSWAYLRSFLMDDVMVKVDRATMWMGLEARAPLLDPRVVQAVFHIPDRYKTGVWKGKRLLKELVRDTLPASILDRPKHGFGVPTAAWLRGPLAEELRASSDPSFLSRQGLFDPVVISRMANEHAHGRPDRRKELWAYLLFQRWWHRWGSSTHA